MGKLTKRLIKYFTGIISAVVIICLILSGLFLSFIYTNIQYSDMKKASDKLYEAIKTQSQYADIIAEYQISSAFLVKNGETTTLTSNMMGMLKTINISNLYDKGKYVNQKNEEFLYYKTNTDIGEIIILQNNKFSSTYMKYTYIILAIIFLVALLISIPIIALLGKRITEPVILLQKASQDITKGKFDIDVKVNTKDEIEDLSKSIKYMAEVIEKRDIMQREFIANVSHDFKTPLSIIRNYSEAVYDDILDEKEKKEYTKEIIKEVDRLNSLVMDILQLSKLQVGKEILGKEYFNLSEFLSSFQNTFKIQLQQKNINFKVEVTDFNIDIMGDSKYLHRVIYNFVDNAVKFSKENGFIQIGALETVEGLKIHVKDNGIGIDSRYIEDIWERYYKNLKSGGMGIGLAICSEILKLHSFKYGAVSKEGQGSEFYFVVPKTEYIKR